MRSGTQGTAGMSQTSAFDHTIADGEEYTLTFNFAVENGDGTGGNSDGVAELWAISSTAGDTDNPDFDTEVSVLATQSFGTNTNDMSSTGSLGYTATGSDDGDRLAIAFYTADFNNPIFFDNAELSVVPEPNSFALLAGCFGLTWVMLRRRS